MGGTPTSNRTYGVFVGEEKQGESRVLVNATPYVERSHKKTMVEEFR